MSVKELPFLLDTLPEFDFIEGLEGGNHVEDYAVDGDLSDAITDALANVSQLHELKRTKEQPKKAVPHPAASYAQWINQCTRPNPPSTGKGSKWVMPWPVNHFVWRLPEGAGKSSIVKELVDYDFHVVFCSKSNEQLVAQEQSFRARWPDLIINRWISKGRHLQEQLKASFGIDFEFVHYEPTSPYSPAVMDEPSTRQALRKALDEAGYANEDHRKIFDAWYTEYKQPPIAGWQTNVIMMTIAAFQALCTTQHTTWWNRVGLIKPGEKRKVSRRGKDIQLPVGLPKIIVIIDDPDRTDFDFRRYVDEEEAVKLHHARRKLSAKDEPARTVQYWLDKGHGPHLAAELAKHNDDRAKTHEIESLDAFFFEARPSKQYIGYGLQRGFPQSIATYGGAAKDCTIPKILVTTTEAITAELATRTLEKVMGWPKGVKSRRPPKVTNECHVTLLKTPITRKAHSALLLLIMEKLRREFPKESLALIGDGLGCELNLSNNRGRNDLMQHSTVVKLSVPNHHVAINLWAQFPEIKNKGALNTLLLSDLANQAIGRNQGNRYQGKPCVLLVDPIYAAPLVEGGSLRYRKTPWSFMGAPQEVLPLHYDITPFEQRLMELIELPNARRLGLSLEGLKLGFELPIKQRRHYEAWLDRERMHVPWDRE